MIAIAYDPFSMESQVCIAKAGGDCSYEHISSDLSDAAIKVVRLAYQNDISNIGISAPSAIKEEFERLILEYELNTYSNNKLTVEGI